MLFTVSMKNDRDFRAVYKKGRYISCGEVTAYFLPNRMALNRLGITTGKKIGNAVCRNRARRIIRAAYRLSEEKFPIGYDIVFTARQGIDGKSSCDIERFIIKRLIPGINKSFSDKGGGKGGNPGKGGSRSGKGGSRGNSGKSGNLGRSSNSGNSGRVGNGKVIGVNDFNGKTERK